MILIHGIKGGSNMKIKEKDRHFTVPVDRTKGTGRVFEMKARPCVFRDKRKAAELDRGKWKNEIKKGGY